MRLTSHVLLQPVRPGMRLRARERLLALFQTMPSQRGRFGGTLAAHPEKTATSWHVMGFGETLPADYNQTPGAKSLLACGSEKERK